MLLADRAYDADWIQSLCYRKGFLSERSAQKQSERAEFSSHLYRARNLVEQFFNKIKQCRRVATRYDKLAANYLAFIQPGSIRLWGALFKFTAFCNGPDEVKSPSDCHAAELTLLSVVSAEAATRCY